MQIRQLVAGVAIAASAVLALTAWAGGELVAFPANFAHYTTVDRGHVIAEISPAPQRWT
jgi:hypothetical protein